MRIPEMKSTKASLSQRHSKLQRMGAVLIAVADPQNGFTGACLLQEDKHKGSLEVCEYLFHTREPVSNDREKVIFQGKNVYSALEFWQDSLVLCDGVVVVISDLPEEHFSRDIRIIRHQLKLKRKSKGFTGAIQIVPYDENPVYYPPPRSALLSLPFHGHGNSSSNAVQIHDESWLPILQICQHAAKTLSTGNITAFKQLLIGNQINIQKFTRISQ